jgi:hypothetical protein
MKSLSRVRVGILLGTAASALLLLPLSCGDDTSGGSLLDASGGGDSSRDTGPVVDSTTDTKPDAPKEAAAEAEAAADTGGGDADAGMDVVTDAPLDAPADAPTEADAASPCGPPTDPTAARACVVISGTDQVTPVTLADGAATDLDNMGTLLIYVFAVPNPGDGGADGGAATPIAQPIAYPPPDDAGLFSVEMSVAGLTSLPPIPIDLPPGVTTAYILTYFVDNKAGFAAIQQSTLTYGMYVGGLDLSQGLSPVPQIRAANLVTGQGTIVNQYLTVMRRFDTWVVRLPTQLDGGGGIPPAAGGDGTGPIEVGVYRSDVPDPMRVYGAAFARCADIVHDAPFPVTGFFYDPATSIPDAGPTSIWYSGLLNDFGDTTKNPPAGSMISAALNDAGTTVVPPQQTAAVGVNDYSVTLAQPIVLTTTTASPTTPDGGPIPDFVHCPFPPPDAGSDAATD